MISRNNQAIFTDSGRHSSQLATEKAPGASNQWSYKKKAYENKQILKPNVTNINASVDGLQDESRFGRNFSSLNTKVMQQQSGKMKT